MRSALVVSSALAGIWLLAGCALDVESEDREELSEVEHAGALPEEGESGARLDADYSPPTAAGAPAGGSDPSQAARDSAEVFDIAPAVCRGPTFCANYCSGCCEGWVCNADTAQCPQGPVGGPYRCCKPRHSSCSSNIECCSSSCRLGGGCN